MPNIIDIEDIEAKVRLDDVIGRIEVETILGVRPRTFSRLLAEGKLPKPMKTLAGGTMLWHRLDIEDLAKTR